MDQIWFYSSILISFMPINPNKMQSVQFKSALGIIEITGDDAGVQTISIQEEQPIKKQPIPKVLEASVK